MAEAAAATEVSTSDGVQEPGAAAAASASKLLGDDYSDLHRIVLQGIMAAGKLDSKGVKRLFVGVCQYLSLDTVEYTKMSYVQKVVREVNDRIRPYDMAIRSASCELSGKKFYIYLLTVEKPLMTFQSVFTQFEVQFFQRIMRRSLREYNYFGIPMTECLNMARKIDSTVKLDNAERFIWRMIEMSYLAKYVMDEENFNVTLGFRGIREFEPILRDLYSEVMANCCLCHMILLHGYLCPGCKTHVHRPCYNRFDPIVKLCPKCNHCWDESVMIIRTREAEGLEFTAGPSVASTSQALRKQMQKLSIATPAAGPSGSDDVAGPSRASTAAGPSRAESRKAPESPAAASEPDESIVDPEPTVDEAETPMEMEQDDQSQEVPNEEPEPEENPDSSDAENTPGPKAAPKKRKGRRGRARRGSRR